MNDLLKNSPVVPMQKEITTSYAACKEKEITLHDGSVIHLHKAGKD